MGKYADSMRTRDLSGACQWGSAGIPNTREPALLLCCTYARMPYIRHNAVCRMPYEICRTGARILSNDLIDKCL